jgi:5-methylcytosine-specific restriction endonuclease McrA
MPKRRGALPPTLYREIVRWVYERDNWQCFDCDARRNLTPHHIMPRSHGGNDGPLNLITLCVPCHEKLKGGKWEEKVETYSSWTRTRKRS